MYSKSAHQHISTLAYCTLLFAASFTLPADNRLTWESQRKLAWSDFHAKRPRNTPLMAMTYSTIFYEYAVDGSTLSMKVVASFDEETSWTRDDTSAYLLNHEQLHFDITEIFARKFRKTLSTTTFTQKNYATKIRELHMQNITDWKKYQDQYDYDTDNSVIRSAQAEWNVKVATELQELSGYNMTDLVLVLD